MSQTSSSTTRSGNSLPVLGGRWMMAVVLLVSLVVTAAVTTMLYTTMQRVFRASIDQRLKSMASIAAINFDAVDLDHIKNSESVGTPFYEKAVKQLQQIRSQAVDIRYAYILRSTSDPNTMEFVADADSLHPDQKVDLNGDGKIDEEDALTYPGDSYDVTPFPEFRADAFRQPFVDPDFTTSQWGIFLAGTAPIRYGANPDKPTHYAIGLDLNISQYWKLLQSVFIPFIAFSAFLLLVITFQAFTLRILWKRQVRQLAEIDRQKDELISIVSHQLASPISSVQWSLQDMVDGDFGQLTDEQKAHLQEDMKTTRNLLDLAGLLLDVSRIELGRLKMSKQKQSLSEFFKEIITVIEQKAKEKGVNFSHTLPKSLPDGTFDKRLTHMTVENLLTNAVKYTPVGGSVNLSVAMQGGTLFCIVKDTGVGIPKKDQPQLFGKLFRASNVQDVDGNGFGLYVAKGAIEQQGGKIRFESEEGKGTTFFVELPV